MKDTVLKVISSGYDPEANTSTMILKGSNPYYKNSYLFLEMEYPGEYELPEVGEDYILKLQRWKDILKAREEGR